MTSIIAESPDGAGILPAKAGPGGPAQTWRSAPRESLRAAAGGGGGGGEAAANLVHHVGGQEGFAEHGKVVLFAQRFFFRREDSAGHHDDEHARLGLQKLDAQLDAVAVGEHVVEQGGIGLFGGHQLAGFGGGFGGEQL